MLAGVVALSLLAVGMTQDCSFANCASCSVTVVEVPIPNGDFETCLDQGDELCHLDLWLVPIIGDPVYARGEYIPGHPCHSTQALVLGELGGALNLFSDLTAPSDAVLRFEYSVEDNTAVLHCAVSYHDGSFVSEVITEHEDCNIFDMPIPTGSVNYILFARGAPPTVRVDNVRILTEENVCIECNTGFYLDSDNVCQPCTDFHTACTQCSLEEQCTSCDAGFYLDGNTCSLCLSAIEGCAECTDATTCSLCESEYGVNNEGDCELCSSLFHNCKTCSSEGCTECIDGWGVNPAGRCAKCSGKAHFC